YDVWLMDAFTKDSLDMRHNPTYAFNVNLNDASSYGKGRFTVIIRQNPALAVHLLTFTGTKATTGSKISWTTENEQDYTNFTVERSIDNGVTFTALGGFASSSQGTYGFLDTEPILGINIYRLKIIDLNGTITYSNVISLDYTHSHTAADDHISVYPNPVKNMLNLFIPDDLPSAHLNQSGASNYSLASQKSNQVDEYSIIIVSNSGAVLKRAISNQTFWQTDVSNFRPGSYVIHVTSTKSKGLVGRCVFIKL
ncbi:MAG: Cadherin-like beta sandwich domain protein, partial [Mucilaginibacter sp.]|nr:Cadherin-like beta sandwich domain protein [Mucilaginibacter sp.]